MKKHRFIMISILASSLLAGCSAKVAKDTEYSGFINDYSKLKLTKSASGHEVLRWIAPNFKESDFRGIYVPPLTYFPPAKPNDRVSQQTLDQVRLYASNRIRSALEKRTTLLPNSSGSKVLVAKVAITAVKSENQDVQFYEVIPAAAIIASTMAASGHRTQNTTLFLELQLIDQDTKKVVMAVVRKGYGKTINNNSTKITADDLKKAIDDMVTDIVNFPQQG